MSNLTYGRILLENDVDIPRLIAVYKMPEIARYLSISDNYFRYVTSTESVRYYKVYENDRLIGAIHLEKQGNVLFMSLLVLPEFQGMGLGTKIVKDIQSDVFELSYDKIAVSVDEGNTASLRLFENAGFIRVSKENELVNYVYQIRTGQND